MNLEEINNKIHTLRVQLRTLIKTRDKLLNKNPEKFQCLKCKKYFPTSAKYNFHIQNICGENIWKCNMCSYVAKSKKFLERHKLCCIKKWCPHCNIYWSDKKPVLNRHIKKCKLASEQKPDVIKEEQKSEIKEILPVHHDEPSQLQPVHLSDDDESQTHLDQSVHNT